ncbi:MULTISPECIES: hypothetical protein [Mycobacterium]|uniref:hypothetical protein n=1 Tax=Mycobacterium TaxID=1763 RepID=UPI001F0CD9DD|nr:MULTISPECIES: hypothetical protein [Mycobacterium]MDM4139878.1 hypothetical protein [Mycobacterium sp. FLAC0960]
MYAIATVAKWSLAVTYVAVCISCTAVAHHAAAQPAGFPNLDSFNAVPVDPFLLVYPKGSSEIRTITFSPPYNMQCSFPAPAQPGPPQPISCTGDMPGMDNVPFNGGGNTAPPSTCVLGAVHLDGAAYRLQRQGYGGCESGRDPGSQFGGHPVLQPGQKITYQNVTCAVGDDRLVACLDTSSQHGFVLKSSGSVAF